MAQLGELKKNEAKFKELGAEIICVLREEAKGVEGLKLVKEKTKADFTLCLDQDAKQTAKYSPGRGKFHSYVLDKTGTVRAEVDGSLTKRATSEQLLKELKAIQSVGQKAGSDDGDN